MAYRADIEIGVKGTRELERLRSLITQSTQAFESLNKTAAKRGGLNQTLSNYEAQLVRAKRAMDNVTAGIPAETKAIREYVTAMGLANAARDRQNYLIAQEIANRRKVQATIDAGYGMQGPALPPAAVTRTGGRGPASTLGGGKLGGIVGNAVIGGAFPLLFGQGGAAATGGAIGGLVGGAFGGAGGFAGSLLGTLLGQRAGQANQVKELANDIGFTAKQTQVLSTAFKQAGADFDKFQSSVSRIQGLSLSLEDQASAIQLASTLTDAYGGKIDKVTNAFTSALQAGKVTQATINQLTSQGIPIQQALADKYNVSRTAILQMAKDGTISVQTLMDVLVDVGNKGAVAANKNKSAFDDGFTKIEAAARRLREVLTAAFDDTSKRLEISLGGAIQRVTTYLEEFILGLAEISRVAGTVLDPLISGYLDLQAAIMGASSVVPFLRDSILNFVKSVLGPLGGVIALIDRVRGTGAARKNQMYGPAVPPRLQTAPIPRITAPASLPPSGGGGGRGKAKGTKERESRVPELMRELAALQQQNLAESLIADARLRGDQQLVIRLQAIQKETQLLNQAASIEADKKLPANEKALQLRIIETQLIRSQAQTEEELAAYAQERQKTFKDLITGVEREIELNGIKNEQAKALRQIEFDILDLQERNKELTAEQIDQYRRLRQAAIEQAKSPAQQRMDELKTSLSLLTNQESIAIAVADNIGAAFGQAFQDVSTGAMSAEQALGAMFKSIGENFINMAAQIIAQQMTMIVLGGIMKALGLGLGGGTQTANTGGFAGMTVPNNALGDAMTLQMMSFADGGFVTGPTRAVVGEGGEPEYIIPASKMSAAMSRYSAGARGSAVIPSSGTTEGDTSSVSGGTAVAGGIDVRFNVERINSVDYVTADQFQAGIRQAAQQGATQGEQRTLRRLQQSRSTRSRLGMA